MPNGPQERQLSGRPSLRLRAQRRSSSRDRRGRAQRRPCQASQLRTEVVPDEDEATASTSDSNVKNNVDQAEENNNDSTKDATTQNLVSLGFNTCFPDIHHSEHGHLHHFHRNSHFHSPHVHSGSSRSLFPLTREELKLIEISRHHDTTNDSHKATPSDSNHSGSSRSSGQGSKSGSSRRRSRSKSKRNSDGSTKSNNSSNSAEGGDTNDPSNSSHEATESVSHSSSFSKRLQKSFAIRNLRNSNKNSIEVEQPRRHRRSISHGAPGSSVGANASSSHRFFTLNNENQTNHPASSQSYGPAGAPSKYSAQGADNDLEPDSSDFLSFPEKIALENEPATQPRPQYFSSQHNLHGSSHAHSSRSHHSHPNLAQSMLHSPSSHMPSLPQRSNTISSATQLLFPKVPVARTSTYISVEGVDSEYGSHVGCGNESCAGGCVETGEPCGPTVLSSFDIRRLFLVLLAEALMTFGSPTYRVEHLVLTAADTLHIKVALQVLYSQLTIVFHSTQVIQNPFGQGHQVHVQQTQSLHNTTHTYHHGHSSMPSIVEQEDPTSPASPSNGLAAMSPVSASQKIFSPTVQQEKSNRVNYTRVSVSHSEPVIVTARENSDYHKLYRTNLLCNMLVQRKVTIEEAIDVLENLIHSASFWPQWLTVLGTIMCGTVLTMISFSGSLFDATLVGALGLVNFLATLIMRKFSALRPVVETSAALLITFLAQLVNAWAIKSSQKGPDGSVVSGQLRIHFSETFSAPYCPMAAVISPLYMFLPGTSISFVMIEIASAHVVTGTSRLAYCMLRLISLAFGIEIGTLLASLAMKMDEQLFALGQCNVESAFLGQRWWAISLALIVYAVMQALRLRIHPKQIAICVLSVLVGYWVQHPLKNVDTKDDHTKHLQSVVATFTATACVGIVCNLYSRVFNEPLVAPILVGVLLLVPGALGLRSTLELRLGQTSETGSLLSLTLFVGLGVGMGIMMSRLVPPLETHLKPSQVIKMHHRLARFQSIMRKDPHYADSVCLHVGFCLCGVKKKARLFVNKIHDSLDYLKSYQCVFSRRKGCNFETTTAGSPAHFANKSAPCPMIAASAQLSPSETSENAQGSSSSEKKSKSKTAQNSSGTASSSTDLFCETKRAWQKLQYWMRRLDWQERVGSHTFFERSKVKKWISRLESQTSVAQSAKSEPKNTNDDKV